LVFWENERLPRGAVVVVEWRALMLSARVAQTGRRHGPQS